MWKSTIRNMLCLLCVSVYLPAVTAATSIDVGMEHSVVLQDDGSVWSWGENYSGQLGNGSTVASRSPVKVKGLGDVVAISAGGYHTLALLADGSVWSWGNNSKGQLGDGTQIDRSEPVRLNGLGAISAIGAGVYHSIALGVDGRVWAWGDNTIGQLGVTDLAESRQALVVAGLPAVTEITSGYWNAYALAGDGTVWLWGDNPHGPPITIDSPSFFEPVLFAGEWPEVLNDTGQVSEVLLPDNTTVMSVSSLEHGLMLRPDGAVYSTRYDSPGADYGGDFVPEVLEVKWTGAVTVNISPAEVSGSGVKWRAGGAWYSSGETAYLEEGLHEVQFASSADWQAPASVSVMVARGSHANLDAAYTAQSGSISVQLMPAAVVAEGAKWRLSGGSWNASGEVLDGVTQGDYTIEYWVPEGWQPPEDATVSVQADRAAVLISEFQAQMASLLVRIGPESIFEQGGRWRIAGGRWYDSGVAMLRLAPGNYGVEFATVDGWHVPQYFSVTLGVDGAMIIANYAQENTSATLAQVSTSISITPVESTEEDVVVTENPVLVELGQTVDFAPSSGSGEQASEAVLSPSVLTPVAEDIVSPAEGVRPNYFSVADVVDVDSTEPLSVEMDSRVDATVAYIGDAAMYKFDASEGQRYVFVSRYEYGASVQMSIYDELGNLVHTQGADSAQQNSLRYAWVAPASNTFHVRVEFSDGASTGNISLAVSQSSVVNDFDGDGQADVLAIGESGLVSLLYMDKGQTHRRSNMPYKMNPRNEDAWHVSALGDFNGDHKTDILWRAKTGQTAVWLMNEQGVLGDDSGVTTESVGGLTQWQVDHAGDFNGDGKTDVLWRHQYSGKLALWFMDGRQVLPESGLVPVPAGAPIAWRIDGVGDFDGDGIDDLLWRNRQSGYTAVWLMAGLEHTEGSGLTSEYVSQSSEWDVVAMGDFDADAKSDILWRHRAEGYLFIWFMDGVNVKTSGYVSRYVDAASAWNIAQVSDTNGDGRADLLWQASDSPVVYIWGMEGVLPVELNTINAVVAKLGELNVIPKQK